METHVAAGCITGAFAGGAFGECGTGFGQIRIYPDNNLSLG